MNQANEFPKEVTLINMDKSSINQTFNVLENTIVGDLQIFLKNKGGYQYKIEIYFNKDEVFRGTQNAYVNKLLQNSFIYYKVDEQLKSILTQNRSSYQENNINQQQLDLSQASCQTKSTYNSKDQKDQLPQKKSVYEQEINEQKDINKKLEIQINNLKKELNDQKMYYEHKITEIGSENNKLIEQVKQLKEKMVLNNSHKQVSNSLQSKVQYLQQEIDEKNQKIEEQKQYIFDLTQKQDIMKNKKKNEENQDDLIKFNNDDNDDEDTQMYQNSCGHKIQKNILEQMLTKALMNKNLARCQTCDCTFSQKVCKQISMIGREYINMKLIIELPNLLNSIKTFEYKYLTLVSCENKNCKFVCFWKSKIKNNTENGFCPNCLVFSVKNPIKCVELTNF